MILQKQEAINAQTEAQEILNLDNPDPDVVAGLLQVKAHENGEDKRFQRLSR